MTTPIIAVLLGTRPEAVKLAPVIVALREASVPAAVFSTGQHSEMVTEVLDQFDIRVDEDLGLMRAGHTLDHVLTESILGVGDLLDEYRPSAVVVQGDTSSAMGSAIAAFHRGVPIGHVEAGLRSGDLGLPFPEEMNRRALAVIARWHFAPTRGAAENLAREGIESGVHVVGNTVVDALRAITRQPVDLPPDLHASVSRPFVLATAHRRESWDGGIGEIARGLEAVLDEAPELGLVFVTHPNPVARAPIEAQLHGHPRATVTGPLPYRVFLELLSRCELAVSDSGGVQEEGPTLGVPVIVTRALTERPEGVKAGAVYVVGTDADRIRTTTLRILRSDEIRSQMRQAGRDIYGDGTAGQQIVSLLMSDPSLAR